jgi:hypothetical protein
MDMSRTATYALGLAVAWSGASIASAAEVGIPRGTYLELKTEDAFDSATAKRGDTFKSTSTRALWVDGELVIPKGSTVVGEIRSVRDPKDGAKSAAIGVRFTQLQTGGKTYLIKGVLVSLKADERQKILESQGKLSTGRNIDVVLIGYGTGPNMRVDNLVGISGADSNDLADDWAKGGLGPPSVVVKAGTQLTMQFDGVATVTSQEGTPGAGDRAIVTWPATIKRLQAALMSKKYYGGTPSGTLDQATRDAIARYQLDNKQPATGDPDDATLRALGVEMSSR